MSSPKSKVEIPSKLSDLRVTRTIGTGTLSRVYLVQDTRPGLHEQFFALKVMNKVDVVRMKQIEHVNQERSIHEDLECPMLVKLHRTFRDSRSIYMLQEFVGGGELFTHLRKAGRFPEKTTKFYAGEIVIALSYLHSRGIVYRDLKPENILLHPSGHIRLTDFGLSKKVETMTWTLCGTPEYLAPEVILSKGHNRAVDWWSLGVLIYEMLVGVPPFYDVNPFGIYEKILADNVWFPDSFDPVAKSLIRGLLTTDKSRRLGNMKNGPEDVKQHPWFAGIDWDALAEQNVAVPVMFPLRSNGDTSFFEVYPHEDFRTGPPGDPFGHFFEDF